MGAPPCMTMATRQEPMDWRYLPWLRRVYIYMYIVRYIDMYIYIYTYVSGWWFQPL